MHDDDDDDHDARHRVLRGARSARHPALPTRSDRLPLLTPTCSCKGRASSSGSDTGDSLIVNRAPPALCILRLSMLLRTSPARVRRLLPTPCCCCPCRPCVLHRGAAVQLLPLPAPPGPCLLHCRHRPCSATSRRPGSGCCPCLLPHTQSRRRPSFCYRPPSVMLVAVRAAAARRASAPARHRAIVAPQCPTVPDVPIHPPGLAAPAGHVCTAPCCCCCCCLPFARLSPPCPCPAMPPPAVLLLLPALSARRGAAHALRPLATAPPVLSEGDTCPPLALLLPAACKRPCHAAAVAHLALALPLLAVLLMLLPLPYCCFLLAVVLPAAVSLPPLAILRRCVCVGGE